LYQRVSEWLLLNSKWELSATPLRENKFVLDEMMMMSLLYYINTQSSLLLAHWLFYVRSYIPVYLDLHAYIKISFLNPMFYCININLVHKVSFRHISVSWSSVVLVETSGVPMAKFISKAISPLAEVELIIISLDKSLENSPYLWL
jgi:hypothetical protein